MIWDEENFPRLNLKWYCFELGCVYKRNDLFRRQCLFVFIKWNESILLPSTIFLFTNLLNFIYISLCFSLHRFSALYKRTKCINTTVGQLVGWTNTKCKLGGCIQIITHCTSPASIWEWGKIQLKLHKIGKSPTNRMCDHGRDVIWCLYLFLFRRDLCNI